MSPTTLYLHSFFPHSILCTHVSVGTGIGRAKGSRFEVLGQLNMRNDLSQVDQWFLQLRFKPENKRTAGAGDEVAPGGRQRAAMMLCHVAALPLYSPGTRVQPSLTVLLMVGTGGW